MTQAHQTTANQDIILQAYFKEYDYLKKEQLQSIGARNHLIFILLILYCGIFSYALGDSSRYYAFLMLPWACFILGWAYFSLQNKIVAIRHYLRDSLSPHITELAGMPSDAPFAEERIYLHKQARWVRKLYEIAINLFLFCIPSIIALGMYLLLPSQTGLMVADTMVIADLVFIVILAVWVVIYSDVSKSTKPPSN